MDAMDAKDIIPVLVQRMNNLETILVSTLIGFILTTTLAIFAAISKNKKGLQKHPLFLLLGANVLYIFLSGYYYFMLTHFYATVSILVPYTKSPTFINGENLWNYFIISSPIPLSDNVRNILSLLNAPIFPLLFSTFALIGVYYLVRNNIQDKCITVNIWKIEKKWKIDKKWIKIMVIPLSVMAQSINCYMMIYSPFLEFLKSIGAIKK